VQPAAPVGDLADQVRQSVQRFGTRTHRERVSRQRFLEELSHLSNPFDRFASPVHVTGSAIVSGPRGTVLHLHKRLGLWLQPGGHIDTGETPWEAAVRETHEETGLVGRLVPGAAELFHLDVHQAGDHLHLDLRYLLQCNDEDPRPGAAESPQARWFAWGEASLVAGPGLVDAIDRLRRWATSSYPPSSDGLNSQSKEPGENSRPGAGGAT